MYKFKMCLFLIFDYYNDGKFVMKWHLLHLRKKKKKREIVNPMSPTKKRPCEQSASFFLKFREHHHIYIFF